MFYSGLVVTCAPQDFEVLQTSLQSMPGIEIHQKDPATGRFVVVLEEETIDAETERFEALRKLEHVVDVSLVVHREAE